MEPALLDDLAEAVDWAGEARDLVARLAGGEAGIEGEQW